MWLVDGHPLACEAFQDQAVLETLLEFDTVFLCVSRFDGVQVLCYWSDFDDEQLLTRWLQAEISAERLAGLKVGELSLADALDGVPLWAVDRDEEGNCLKAWSLENLGVVPDGFKPRVGAVLAGLEGGPGLIPLAKPEADVEPQPEFESMVQAQAAAGAEPL